MKNGGCIICLLVKILAGIGALNWGLIALMDLNLVTSIAGDGTMITKVIYILVGVSGLITLISVIKQCPCTGKTCST